MKAITVVGAGPVGLRTAINLAKNGWDTSVIEEHAEIGKPVQCAGLISKSGVKALGLNLDGCLVNEVKGARIFSPDGTEFKVEKKEKVAAVIDRERFDKSLLKEARRMGVEISTRTSLIDVRGETVFVKRQDRGEIRKSRLVIGADGVNSKVRELMNLNIPLNQKLVQTLQIVAKGSFDKNFVKMYFGGFAEGFFAWVIPESNEKARIGLGTRLGEKIQDKFAQFVAEKNLDIEVAKTQGGLIPIGEPIKPLAKENMMLVGDSAFQTKATSVDGEESIILFEEGLIRTKRIGELVNDKMVRAPEKIKKIVNPVDHDLLKLDENCFALSPSITGEKTKFRPIKSVLKHSLDDALYEIILKKGYRVKVTGEHSVMVLGEKCFTEKKVSDLKKGKDKLLVTLNVPNNQFLEDINIIELIKKEEPELIESIRVKGGKHLLFNEPDERKKIKPRCWYADSIPLNLFLDKGITVNECLFWKGAKNIKIKSKIKVTPELCRLLGYYAAEGHDKQGKKVQLIFGKDDIGKGYVDDALKCIKSTFNIVPEKIQEKLNPETKKKSALTLTFGGTLISQLFSNLLKAGGQALNKEVPFIIFNVKDHLKLEFLKAYLRGDGTIRIRMPKKRKNWSAEISAKTVSRKLASDLIFLSLQLGLLPSVEEDITKERQLYGKKIKGSKSYRIVFSKKEDLLKLADVFPHKKDELISFLESISNSKSNLGLPKETLAYLGETKFSSALINEFGSCLYTGYKNLSYDRLSCSLQKMEIKNERLLFLQNLVNEKIGVFDIKEIRKVRPSSNEVFDVEIPETQMFVAGLGPILLHNTGGGIITGSMASDALVKTISDHFINKKSLGNYEKNLSKVNKELKMHWKTRKFINSLNDKSLNKIFAKLNKMKVNEFLEKEGDMDCISTFLPKLMRRPKFLLFFPQAFKYILS